jgi:hypothetical protein
VTPHSHRALLPVACDTGTILPQGSRLLAGPLSNSGPAFSHPVGAGFASNRSVQSRPSSESGRGVPCCEPGICQPHSKTGLASAGGMASLARLTSGHMLAARRTFAVASARKPRISLQLSYVQPWIFAGAVSHAESR